MSKPHGTQPIGEDRRATPGTMPDRQSSPSAMPEAEAWYAAGMDESAGSPSHTLLSRSAAPQGRRSLFRC